MLSKKYLLKITTILLVLITILLSSNYFEKYTIQFSPINEDINFINAGSDIQIYKEEKNYILSAKSWSKTNKQVYLRQDINLLFCNGFLLKMDTPLKENNDSIVTELKDALEVDSIYNILSYHHAEIHINNNVTSQQYITNDKIYIINFQNNIEFFKEPENARQEEAKQDLEKIYYGQRAVLLEKAVKDLNINKLNYEIFDLDKFSLAENVPKSISEESWNNIIGYLWEGIFHTYIQSFTVEELNEYNPPMPWVMLDKAGTHIIILYQLSNESFEKHIIEI